MARAHVGLKPDVSQDRRNFHDQHGPGEGELNDRLGRHGDRSITVRRREPVDALDDDT